MKHILIVGASSGIGFELAKKLSTHNHITALGRSEKELNGISNLQFYPVDITNEQPEFPVLDTPIDGLIYCPGSITLKPFRGLKNEDFLNDWNVNFMGAVKTIRNYLPLIQQSEKPSIVLFSTVAVQMGMTFHTSISAAKGAIEGLTRSLAAEFAPKIRVNAIAPSLTNTPLAEKLLNAETKIKAAEERHPLKTIGQPSDIADAVDYLLNANWVTGQILHVDGGMSSVR